jgi:hypothetical protein
VAGVVRAYAIWVGKYSIFAQGGREISNKCDRAELKFQLKFAGVTLFFGDTCLMHLSPPLRKGEFATAYY